MYFLPIVGSSHSSKEPCFHLVGLQITFQNQKYTSLCHSAWTLKITSIPTPPLHQSLEHSGYTLFQRPGIDDGMGYPHNASLHSKCANNFILGIALLQLWIWKLTDTVRYKSGESKSDTWRFKLTGHWRSMEQWDSGEGTKIWGGSHSCPGHVCQPWGTAPLSTEKAPSWKERTQIPEEFQRSRGGGRGPLTDISWVHPNH